MSRGGRSASATRRSTGYKACLPWVKALLERRRGAAAGPLIHGHLRFVVIDGSTVQGPGANGTGYRLHIAVDGVKWHLIQVEGSDKHPGEQWGDSPLQEGDVGVLDRGYHPAKGLLEQADPGVSGVLRYHQSECLRGGGGEN